MARPGRSPRLRKEVLNLQEEQQQRRLVCTRRHVIRQQPCGSRAGVQPAGTSSVALNCRQPQNPRLFQPQPTRGWTCGPRTVREESWAQRPPTAPGDPERRVAQPGRRDKPWL